ncbi:MerR family transcriptional regulator [Amycolatopsis sp. H20-H5]|uniref:MerR family transcriptional regulator n=1 Tax=Amycolatopsis sp. H20-H5 TaxID=3046309 RepID=UPI002DBD5DEA|nr:MerR family transcriptional regulator [Amycolatopsis sp. H20-H5]MEC3979328.1 MerR family transcriptional regulator [Amycolatopsis sp. H20-H5]
MGTYRISQVTDRTGVPATTLRFYEQAGLLPAGRSAAGYRLYDDASLDRLAFIASAKGLGLQLEDIAELLSVRQDGACVDLRDKLRPLVSARLTLAQNRVDELTTLSDQLTDTLARLEVLPASESPCTDDCGFPHPAKEVPIACSLAAAGQDTRAQRWRELLGTAPRERITGGIRVELPAALASAVAELVVAEQQCCPFFAFRLRFAADVVQLLVQAPEQAASLLDELFGPVVQARQP